MRLAMQIRTMPLTPFAMAAIALVLAGCNGAGLALRGVGAPARVTTAEYRPGPESQPVAGTVALAAPVAAAEPVAAGEVEAATTREEAPIPVAAELGRTARIGPAEGTPLNVAGPAVPQSRRAAAVPPEPEMATTREAAVRDIRAKAAATGKNPPNVFDVREGTAEPIGAAEKERLKAELEAAANGNEEGITPEEAKRRQESLQRLQKRAGTHYKEALSSIEN